MLQGKFQLLKVIGKGAHGKVFEAIETVHNQHVAIKEMNLETRDPRELKRVIREMRSLRLLKHENVVNLHTVILCPNYESVYLVFELMETDLARIIASAQILSEQHCQFIIYQLLRGLKFLHTANIIHRDLKPKNLLVNSQCELKIADFGLARLRSGTGGKPAPLMTGYVETRWYRAPELLLLERDYDQGIDVWAAGCIFAEMLRRQTLFPGDDALEQLYLINKAVGPIRRSRLKAFAKALPATTTKKRFSRRWSRSKGTGKDEMIKFISNSDSAPSLLPYLKNCSQAAADFAKTLLCPSPSQRCTAAEALSRPYLAILSCPQDEPEGPRAACSSEFAYESEGTTLSGIQRLIVEEVGKYQSLPVVRSEVSTPIVPLQLVS